MIEEIDMTKACNGSLCDCEGQCNQDDATYAFGKADDTVLVGGKKCRLYEEKILTKAEQIKARRLR
jgi:hypothetical protein